MNLQAAGMDDFGLVYQSISQLHKDNTDNDEARRKGEVVHSGHFMMSSVADDQEDHEEIDHDRDSPVHHEQIMAMKHGYDFSNVPKETKNTYQFGPLQSNQITIDASLSRLFQCMSLAYHGGKVVSPKWKNFKGMKLTVKDKIRLNNAIWRTWHIQYVMRRKKHQSLIQFATPLEVDGDYDSHARPEAVVMEGKYWKRRIETVVAEYKKWRAFFMEKLRLSDYPGLMWVSENTNSPIKDIDYERMRSTDEPYMADFTDTLFSSLSQQPFQFPNPREIAMHATNADMIQPGLLQLQPVMDDDMEFDPFQDLLNLPKKPVMSFIGSSNQNFPHNGSDGFSANDFAQILDNNNSHSKLTNTPSTQSVDYMSSFGPARKQPEYHSSLQGHASTADPIFSAVNCTTVQYTYPTNTVQPQQNTINQMMSASTQDTMPNMVPQFNSFQQQKFHNGNMQQTNTKPNSSTTELPAVLYARVQRNLVPSVYPHSKLGSNMQSNKIIYSQSQTSPLEFIQPNQNHMIVQHQGGVVQQIAATTQDMNANVMPGQVNKQPNNQLITGQNNTVNMHTQEPNSASISATTSNVILLKQLLTNKSSATTTTPSSAPIANHRKSFGKSSRNSLIQPKPVQQSQFNQPQHMQHLQQQQQQMVRVTTNKHPVMPVATIMAALPNQATAVPSVTEKPMDEIRSDLPMADPWPQINMIEAQLPSPPAKPSIQDVDMEQAVLEPVSPLPQDSEIAQMEMLQRQGSFSAEQKRRFNIKIGFTRLQKLLPGSSNQANTKISKATLMSKAAQHMKLLQTERAKMNDEIQALKQDLDKLKSSINNCQLQLPATGAPVARPRLEEAKGQFKAWTKQRTKQNWKFHVFGVIIRPWFETYHRMVSVASSQELHRTVYEWLDQNCSLRELRPSVVQSLQILSTTTTILTNPALMQHQIEDSVKDKEFNDARHGGGS